MPCSDGDPRAFSQNNWIDFGKLSAKRTSAAATAIGRGVASQRENPVAEKMIKTNTPGRTARQPRSLLSAKVMARSPDSEAQDASAASALISSSRARYRGYIENTASQRDKTEKIDGGKFDEEER